MNAKFITITHAAFPVLLTLIALQTTLIDAKRLAYVSSHTLLDDASLVLLPIPEFSSVDDQNFQDTFFAGWASVHFWTAASVFSTCLSGFSSVYE